MTNKTIIDGIDVSECEFFCSTAKFHKCDCLGGKARENSTVENLNCEENPNCYFKQLARAKEEIEKLKSENFTFEELVKTQENLIDTYTQELEEIKKEFQIETLGDLTTGKRTYRSLMLLKYKQVLDEIKELSTNAYCLANGTDKDMSNFAKQILNLINKAKETNERMMNETKIQCY